MSKIDDIKNKIKNSNRPSIHNELIDSGNGQVDQGPVKREKKKKFEELYTRSTIWIENDILKKIEQTAAGERGEKTRIVNDALKMYLAND
ncbi:hypothetical protein D3C73_1012810 [compost metagenome]